MDDPDFESIPWEARILHTSERTGSDKVFYRDLKQTIIDCDGLSPANTRFLIDLGIEQALFDDVANYFIQGDDAVVLIR